jgi:putative endonuclease
MHSRPHFYYVYIMTNRSKTLCTGVTGYLERRAFEHKQGIRGEFAARYRIDRLVIFERFGEVHAVIARGKQIKGLLRIKKIALIVSMNPDWKDGSEAWYVRHRYEPENAWVLRQRAFRKAKASHPQDDKSRAAHKTHVILSAGEGPMHSGSATSPYVPKKGGGSRRPSFSCKSSRASRPRAHELRSFRPPRQILFLLRREPVDLDADRLQLQLGDSLVEIVGNLVDTFFQRLVILHHVVD